MGGEATAQGPGGHPTGAASHQLLGEREWFVPLQCSLIQQFQHCEQDRRLDRAGGSHRPFGLHGCKASVVEDQHVGAGLQIALLRGQLQPALTQRPDFLPGGEACLLQALRHDRSSFLP